MLPAVVYAIMRKRHFGSSPNAQIGDSRRFNILMDEIFRSISTRIENVGGDQEIVTNVKTVFDEVKNEWIVLSNNKPALYFPDYGSAIRREWDDKLYLSPNKKLEIIANADGQYPDERKGVMNTLRNVEESTPVQTRRYN